MTERNGTRQVGESVRTKPPAKPRTRPAPQDSDVPPPMDENPVVKRTERIPPSAIEDEDALLGALLLNPSGWEDVSGMLTPDDFYRPGNRLIYQTIEAMARAHENIDVVTVASRMRAEGHSSDRHEDIGQTLMAYQEFTPRISHLHTYAARILDASQARVLIRIGGQLAELGFDRVEDAYERAKMLLHDASRDMMRTSLVTTTPLLSDLLDASPTWAPADWIIPGMLARKHRLVVAAKGGRGKSTFIRQTVCFIAAGFHPFIGDSLHMYKAPMRTSLVVDLENDQDAWMLETRPMMEMLRAKSGVWPLPLALHALGGRSFDPVQNRSDKADLFARLRETRPDLLCIGPLYKLDQKSGAEWHQTAGRIQDLLDDIRETFKCAILVEAHVGSSGAAVRGAKDWEFWPEMVKRLSFVRGDRTRLQIDDVRTPRFRQLYDWWPTQLAKHTNTMPSRAQWPTGAFPPDGGRPAWDRPPDWQVSGLVSPLDMGRVEDAPPPVYTGTDDPEQF